MDDEAREITNGFTFYISPLLLYSNHTLLGLVELYDNNEISGRDIQKSEQSFAVDVEKIRG